MAPCGTWKSTPSRARLSPNSLTSPRTSIASSFEDMPDSLPTGCRSRTHRFRIALLSTGGEELLQDQAAFGGHDTSRHGDSMVEPVGSGDVEHAPRRSGFGVGRPVDEPAEASVDHRPGAHRARLEGDDEGAVEQTPVADVEAASRIARISAWAVGSPVSSRSLCRAAITSPPSTTTAPTGTSSCVAAARASPSRELHRRVDFVVDSGLVGHTGESANNGACEVDRLVLGVVRQPRHHLLQTPRLTSHVRSEFGIRGDADSEQRRWPEVGWTVGAAVGSMVGPVWLAPVPLRSE